ncbi:hypothetical protein Q3G72_005976 [Acer saccharum]|nr:hypothetical protein Q3G72_005976 [Acer saccharum]
MGCFGKLRHKKRAANNQAYNDAALKSNTTKDVEVAVEARVEVVVEAGVVLVVAGEWDITEGLEVAEVESAVVEAEDAVEVEAVEVHGLN